MSKLYNPKALENSYETSRLVASQINQIEEPACFFQTRVQVNNFENFKNDGTIYMYGYKMPVEFKQRLDKEVFSYITGETEQQDYLERVYYGEQKPFATTTIPKSTVDHHSLFFIIYDEKCRYAQMFNIYDIETNYVVTRDQKCETGTFEIKNYQIDTNKTCFVDLQNKKEVTDAIDWLFNRMLMGRCPEAYSDFDREELDARRFVPRERPKQSIADIKKAVESNRPVRMENNSTSRYRR